MMGRVEPVWKRREALLTAIAGACLALGLLLSLLRFNLSALFYLAAVIFGAYPFAYKGFKALRMRSLNIHFLVGLAVVGAVAIGEVLEAASLAFLFSLAELLEAFSVERAKRSLKELMELAPSRVRLLRDGREVVLPVEEVQVGEVIAVRPGERIALDGIVLKGRSAVDQAPITGESVPVDKGEGDQVYAGSINREGYLEIKVTRRAQETTLAKIVHLIEEAQRQKSSKERFIERFGRYYTPAVVAVAVGVAVLPPIVFGAPFSQWFPRALVLLVIACPCALLISTPVSVISAITSAARYGVLIKGGKYLELMGQIRAIALDKTGTLTQGELEVTDIIPLNGHSPAEVLKIAASLEGLSHHPIAQAIVRAYEESGGPTRAEVEDFTSLTGLGVQGRLNGRLYRVGKPQLFNPERGEGGWPLLLSQLERQGKTVVLVGTQTRPIGLIAVADRLRPEAKRAISELKRLGLEIVMITGDNEGTAQAIAHKLGITHYHAQLLPDQKVHEIRHLLEEYGSVAMIGDGINDAPALAAATVGIAMGAAGTDTALETADIALMADDLAKLPYLIALSRKAQGVIGQNVFSSITVKLLLGLGVFPGWVSLVTAVLAGDMGMTLAVTGNALRLARLRPRLTEARSEA